MIIPVISTRSKPEIIHYVKRLQDGKTTLPYCGIVSRAGFKRFQVGQEQVNCPLCHKMLNELRPRYPDQFGLPVHLLASETGLRLRAGEREGGK